MLQEGGMNSVTKVVSEPSLARYGGTRYRDVVGGHFAPNPNKGKSWYCQKSPTGAHPWVITAH
jgi:hypothetical protein